MRTVQGQKHNLNATQSIASMSMRAVQGQKHSLDAAQFIANASGEHPGEVVVLALGPLTNIALAYKVDAAVRTRLVRPNTSSIRSSYPR